MAIKSASPFFKKNLYLTIAISVLFLIIGFLPFLSHEQQSKLLVEHGLFESLSVYLYFLCLILIFITWTWKKILSKWYFSALIILFSLRELDYDKAYFTHGILKSRQYFSELVSITELMISIIILSFIFVVLISIILKERKNFLNGIKSYEQPQLAILTSIIIVAITKTIDGSERKFGINLSDSIERLTLIIEEVGEMGIPIMFMIAVISNRINKKLTCS